MTFNIPVTNKPRLVIVGGGFAGLNLARGLKRADLQIVVLDKNNYHTFQPLLYQVATAGLEPDSIAYPLRKILRKQKNVIFRMAEVTRVFPESNEIETSIGRIRYDYLAIATGSKPNFFGNQELSRKVMTLKSIQDAFDLRNFILQRFEQALLTSDMAERDALQTFVIVGGGPTGVELAGALGELQRHILPNDYPELDLRRMQIHLIEAAPRLLPTMSSAASDSARKFLENLGVTIWLGKPVSDYDGHQVHLPDGKAIRSETVIWTAGVLGAPIAGLPATALARNGRIYVDEQNAVNGLENIFALGDIATMTTDKHPHGHPMVAQPAIQQGRHLAANLRRRLRDETMRPFVYRDPGDLATIGRNRAVADLGRLRFQGFTAWLLWIFIHLMNLIGFRNKLVVLINWVWNYFTYDRGIRLIFRGFREPAGGRDQPASQPELPAAFASVDARARQNSPS